VAGMSGGEVEGVLITGVYGAGKSSVAEEIAHALEARGARFGAVDLDWLIGSASPGRARKPPAGVLSQPRRSGR
jgi:Mrp family chromosome partitioning ATPase